MSERVRAIPGVRLHESAVVDAPASVGEGTAIWHFAHVQAGARIGRDCVLGQGVNVGPGVVLGDGCRVQNHVSLFAGVEAEDFVFFGPSCALTNVTAPRAEVDRSGAFERTRFRRGATVGANATVVCGVTVGRYAFVAAGAVVTADVPDYALVVGVPGRRVGWMSRHGHRLDVAPATREAVCPGSGLRYREADGSDGPALRCLDLDEDAPLPEGRL